MATSLTAQIRASITAAFTDDQDLGDPSVQVALSALESLANGTSNVQADLIYAEAHTIAASGTLSLDMGTGGGLLTPFGDAFEPAEVVAVLVIADEGNTNNVIVGDAAAEPFDGPMAGTDETTHVKPGGILLWFANAGWAVTNNSNDKLLFTNSAGSTGVTFSMVILARSA